MMNIHEQEACTVHGTTCPSPMAQKRTESMGSTVLLRNNSVSAAHRTSAPKHDVESTVGATPNDLER